MNEEKNMTPVKAIKAKCLDCCCGDRGEVKECPVKDCPLWQYRKWQQTTSLIILTSSARLLLRDLQRLGKRRRILEQTPLKQQWNLLIKPH